MIKRIALLTLLTIMFHAPAHAAQHLSVLELFTSQGCSSCPPAEELLNELGTDSTLLPLSIHVTYWNKLGWIDPYSSDDNTKRQYAYAKQLHLNSVFTPQLVVGGAQSVTGSNREAVQSAIETVRKQSETIQAMISQTSSGSTALRITGRQTAADVWEMHFIKHATTNVRAGENGGRTLDSINNVVSIKKIGTWPKTDNFIISPLEGEEDGIAVLLQEPDQGKILGSAVYTKQ